MKVLIDIRLLGRGGNSGIHEYTRELTDHLTAEDSENHYLLWYAGLFKVPLPQSWCERQNTTILDWRIPNKVLDAGARILHAPRIDEATGADIVLSPHINLVRTGRKPHIMTFHDLSFVHYPSFFSLKKRLWHALQAWKTEANRAAHLIADSEFTKGDLISLGIREEKISVVYPGINPAFQPLPIDDPRRTALRERRNLHKPFLLYLGTLEPRKNISAAIRAFTLLKENPRWKDLAFVIAGSPGWLYQEILREARTSKAARDIVFLGTVEDSERILLYNEAEAFVYPSFFEGFGFPPLEAQSSGCPVVVADRTSLPEIIGNSGVLVNPWKVVELKDAIALVLEKGKKRDAYIASGLANARRFTWNNATEEIRKILKMV